MGFLPTQADLEEELRSQVQLTGEFTQPLARESERVRKSERAAVRVSESKRLKPTSISLGQERESEHLSALVSYAVCGLLESRLEPDEAGLLFDSNERVRAPCVWPAGPAHDAGAHLHAPHSHFETGLRHRQGLSVFAAAAASTGLKKGL